WEINSIGYPGDIGIARRVGRYAKTLIEASSAKVSGIEGGRAGAVEPRHKNIGAGMQRSLESTWGGGEIGGISRSYDIGMTCRIDRYGGARLDITSAQVS